MVGCVDPASDGASEGASDASGVALWVGVGIESFCGSSCSCCAALSSIDGGSSCARKLSAGCSRGKTIGSVASRDLAIFLFRFAARLGNDWSSEEIQGSYQKSVQCS